MRLTGQRITEKLVTDGRVTEASRYNEKINQKYKTVIEIRRLYWDVLSVTDTWEPGFRPRIEGTEPHRANSERGSHRSHGSKTSESRKEEELRLQAELAQANASQEALQQVEQIEQQKLELTHRAEQLKRDAHTKGIKAKLQTISEDSKENQSI